MTLTTISPQRPPYYVKAIAMAVPALMLGFQISGWIFFLPGAMQGHCDFRHLYTAGYMLRTGYRSALYDYGTEKRFQDSLVSPEAIALPFNHLAYESLLFVPYSWLRYKPAYFLFLATNIGLLVAALRFMDPWMDGIRNLLAWLPAAMFVTFLPVAAALMQGQDSILMLLLIAAAGSLLHYRRPFWGGFLLGFGMFKFQIVLPILALFLLWRRWRFSAGIVISASAVLLVSLWLVGLSQLHGYLQTLLSMSLHETAVDQIKFNIVPVMMPNLRGLIAACCRPTSSPILVQVVTGLVSIAALGWAATRGQGRLAYEQLSLATITATLCSYHLLIHDLAILLVPFTLILNSYFLSDKPDDVAGALSALTFAAPGIIAVSNVHPFAIAIPLLFLWLSQTRRVFPLITHVHLA